MLKIASQVSIPDTEIEIYAIRALGAGGQNVNKVSTKGSKLKRLDSKTRQGQLKALRGRINFQ